MKSYDPPKCKLCGERHAMGTAHTYGGASAEGGSHYVRAWPVPPQPITKTVTRVTPEVTESLLVTAAVTESHECPICGLPHHRPLSDSEKQRAYRERRKAKA